MVVRKIRRSKRRSYSRALRRVHRFNERARQAVVAHHLLRSLMRTMKRHMDDGLTVEERVAWQDIIHRNNREGEITNEQTEELLTFLKKGGATIRRRK